jgi:SRSO17 transposase
MKEELGLDHFEGRSWRGFHHHAAMVILAYGFLLLERERARVDRERAGSRRTPRKKGSPSGC